MGMIIGSEVRPDGKVVFQVLADKEESLTLKGHLDNIHLFSEDVAENEVTITQRGTNDATMYFLIPKEMRNFTLPGKASCQRIDTKSKTIFVYVIDKFGLK